MSPRDTLRFIKLIDFMTRFYGSGLVSEIRTDDVRRARMIINA